MLTRISDLTEARRAREVFPDKKDYAVSAFSLHLACLASCRLSDMCTYTDLIRQAREGIGTSIG